MSRKTWVVAACLFLSLCLCFNGLCFARGSGGSSGGSGGGYSSGGGGKSSGGGYSSGGGGGKSSGSSWGSTPKGTSSGSWGSTTKPGGDSWGSTPKGTSSDSWGSTTKPQTGGQGAVFGGRDATKSTPKTSGADKALYEKAKVSGTAFKSRDDAVKSFQEKNATKYANKFAAEPQVRPGHIPATTTVGGSQYAVIYSSQYGGYGYYNGASWIMYDAMRDVVMMNALMNQNHYYYGPAPWPSAGSVVLLILFGVCCVGLISFLVFRVRG